MDELLLIALLCCVVAAVWAFGAVLALAALLWAAFAAVYGIVERVKKRRAENSNPRP